PARTLLARSSSHASPAVDAPRLLAPVALACRVPPSRRDRGFAGGDRTDGVEFHRVCGTSVRVSPRAHLARGAARALRPTRRSSRGPGLPCPAAPSPPAGPAAARRLLP